MKSASEFENLLGRERETRRLKSAMLERQSRLICGPADSGKTSLIKKAIAELPESERCRCLYWSGLATRRQLAAHLVSQLYAAGNSFIREKVEADGAGAEAFDQWLNDQSSLRLRGLLFTAAERSNYFFFLDHLHSVTPAVVRLLKDIIYRTKTPVYLTSRGCTLAELGAAWSLYSTSELRIELGPLAPRRARQLLETCIRRNRLYRFDLEGFREEVLRLSGCIPGGVVKMCELAANPRYHYGDRVKVKLVHVDFLMQFDHEKSAIAPGRAV